MVTSVDVRVSKDAFVALDPLISRAAVAFQRHTGHIPAAGICREIDGLRYVIITADEGARRVYRVTTTGALKRLRRPPAELAEYAA